jgi:hypothetical protein
LNGYRKKHKLEIAAIQLEDVLSWMQKVNWQSAVYNY